VTAAAVLSLLADLGTKLAPMAIDYVTGRKRDLEAARATAYAAVDEMIADLSSLRAQVEADDAAAIAEAAARDKAT